MFLIERIKKIISILILPVVMLWFFNSVNNRHYHQVPDGSLITHFHPYQKAVPNQGPVKSHNHSNAEFLFLSFFSNTILFLALSIFCIEKSLSFSKFIIYLLPTNLPVKRIYTVRNYHAPPFHF
ncbi:hypothetical protein ES705_21834 [subsurface metagenome]